MSSAERLVEQLKIVSYYQRRLGAGQGGGRLGNDHTYSSPAILELRAGPFLSWGARAVLKCGKSHVRIATADLRWRHRRAAVASARCSGRRGNRLRVRAIRRHDGNGRGTEQIQEEF